MREDLFIYFTTDNISGKKCTEKWLSKNNVELYNKIVNWSNIEPIKDLEFKCKIYHYIHNSYIIPTCLKCNKKVKYKRLKDGYQLYCSSKCQNSCDISKEKWKNSWMKGNSNNEHIVSRNKTILDKYNDLETYKNYVNEIKIKSSLDKYGVEYVMQTESYKEKRKETLKQKYGSEKYNNPSKTKETRIRNGSQIDENNIKDFLDYKKIVTNRTMTIYRNNKEIINPNNLKRGIKSYHIDHKFSLKQGYLYELPIEIITHPVNLEMIYYKDNLVKQDNCSITIEELLNSIIKFEDELKFTNNELKEKYSLVKSTSTILLEKFI